MAATDPSSVDFGLGDPFEVAPMTVKSNNPRCDAWHPTLDHEQCEFDAGHHGMHRVSDPMFFYWWSETEMRRETRTDAGREPDEDYAWEGAA